MVVNGNTLLVTNSKFSIPVPYVAVKKYIALKCFLSWTNLYRKPYDFSVIATCRYLDSRVDLLQNTGECYLLPGAWSLKRGLDDLAADKYKTKGSYQGHWGDDQKKKKTILDSL